MIRVGNDVLRAGLERRPHEALLIGARQVGHEADVIEEVAHGPLRAEVTPVLGESPAQVRPGAVAVIGDALDQHCGATGAVTLVTDRFQITAWDRTARPWRRGPL